MNTVYMLNLDSYSRYNTEDEYRPFMLDDYEWENSRRIGVYDSIDSARQALISVYNKIKSDSVEFVSSRPHKYDAWNDSKDYVEGIDVVDERAKDVEYDALIIIKVELNKTNY